MPIFFLVLSFIALAGGLAWYLLSHDKGEREPIGALWMASGSGVLGAIAAAFIENVVLPADTVSTSVEHVTGQVFLGMMGVGVIEELCKFLPVALFLYRKRYFNEHTDGIIYFALAGLGFGLPENILYTIGFGTRTGILRLVAMPFFHVATTVFVGFFLTRVKLDRRPKWTVVAALAGAMIVHGVYDTGVASGRPILIVLSLMIAAGLTAMLFVLMACAQDLDRKQGLSAVGNNAFCRSCGYPNPDHKLYCQRCGQRA